MTEKEFGIWMEGFLVDKDPHKLTKEQKVLVQTKLKTVETLTTPYVGTYYIPEYGLPITGTTAVLTQDTIERGAQAAVARGGTYRVTNDIQTRGQQTEVQTWPIIGGILGR